MHRASMVILIIRHLKRALRLQLEVLQCCEKTRNMGGALSLCVRWKKRFNQPAKQAGKSTSPRRWGAQPGEPTPNLFRAHGNGGRVKFAKNTASVALFAGSLSLAALPQARLLPRPW